MVPPRETPERAYRRGYLDGWIVLVNHLHELPAEATAETILDLAENTYKHWKGPLSHWARSGGSIVKPPKIGA